MSRLPHARRRAIAPRDSLLQSIPADDRHPGELSNLNGSAEEAIRRGAMQTAHDRNSSLAGGHERNFT